MLSNLTFLVVAVAVVVALTLRCLCYVAVAVVILNVVYFPPCSLGWLRFIVKCCNFQVVKNLNFCFSCAREQCEIARKRFVWLRFFIRRFV